MSRRTHSVTGPSGTSPTSPSAEIGPTRPTIRNGPTASSTGRPGHVHPADQRHRRAHDWQHVRPANAAPTTACHEKFYSTWLLVVRDDWPDALSVGNFTGGFRHVLFTNPAEPRFGAVRFRRGPSDMRGGRSSRGRFSADKYKYQRRQNPQTAADLARGGIERRPSVRQQPVRAAPTWPHMAPFHPLLTRSRRRRGRSATLSPA